MAARYNGHRVAFKGVVTVSEQGIYGAGANVSVQLLNRLGDGRLPVDVHDFAEAMNRCVLVDKTMFIADVLDCDASVVVCCRPEGFGKSMNLSCSGLFWSVPRSIMLVGVCLPILRFGMRTVGAIGMSARAIQ